MRLIADKNNQRDEKRKGIGGGGYKTQANLIHHSPLDQLAAMLDVYKIITHSGGVNCHSPHITMRIKC